MTNVFDEKITTRKTQTEKNTIIMTEQARALRQLV